VRLSIGGAFTAASAQIRRRATTLAAGSLTPPTRVLTLRLRQPRRPRADSIAVAVQLGASTAVR
jgi:hypothetical protein